MRIRFPCFGAFIVVAVSLPLCASEKTTPSALAGIEDRDTDGDGLSDFQEIHKYFTDPRKRATAGRSTPDGDWDERRQFTYSIRSVVRLMPPYGLHAMNDDYQDARVLKQTKDYVELEVISYPLNTNEQAITANPNWQRDYAGMQGYLKPGITSNWDAGMQKNLLAALAKDGIDADNLTDKEVVEKVSRWLMRRCNYKPMFGTMYVHFPNNKPAVLPGLESAFDREKGDPRWSTDEEFAHELLGKEMFYNRTRGSCTSSAVLVNTVFRALGIPCRIILAMPIVDVNDGSQVAMVEKGLHHNQVRAKITAGLLRTGHGFANHTYNEVYVGNRWRRLNYAKLGQNILDEHYFGLMIHTHTFNDLSEAQLAPTWGRRYALALRDDNFKTSNPYCTLEVSDYFGRDSKVPNLPAEQNEHKTITITKAYWLDSSDTPDVIRQGARRPQGGEGHLYIHGDEWFEGQDHIQYKQFMSRADKHFLFRAKGHPAVKGEMQMSFWTHGPSKLRDILVVVPSEELAKMAKGVAYSIEPVNAAADYKWKVKGGLTITREASATTRLSSLEEKLDAVLLRLDKLEKRVEKLETDKRKEGR
jgi:hypothetical protein